MKFFYAILCCFCFQQSITMDIPIRKTIQKKEQHKKHRHLPPSNYDSGDEMQEYRNVCRICKNPFCIRMHLQMQKEAEEAAKLAEQLQAVQVQPPQLPAPVDIAGLFAKLKVMHQEVLPMPLLEQSLEKDMLQ